MHLTTLKTVQDELLRDCSESPSTLLSSDRVSQALTTCDEAVHLLSSLMDSLLRVSESATSRNAEQTQEAVQEPGDVSASPSLGVFPRYNGPPCVGETTVSALSCDLEPIASSTSEPPLLDADDESDSESSITDVDFDSDSDNDSGYVSDQVFPDECHYYRHLISMFAAEGPTMANRGKSAQTMIKMESERWKR